MITPDEKTFVRKARNGNLIAVSKQIYADVHTPVSALAALRPFQHGFLLESVEGPETVGRYSFIGTSPHALFHFRDGIISMTQDGKQRRQFKSPKPLRELKRWMAQYRFVPDPSLPRFCGGAVGYLGYNMVRTFEYLPNGRPEDLGMDDMSFMITDTLLVFDRVDHTLRIIANAHITGSPKAAYKDALSRINRILDKLSKPIAIPQGEIEVHAAGKHPTSNCSRTKFEGMVHKAKKYIRAGDVIQVVLSQRFKQKFSADPLNLYRVLRSINPSPYLYYLKGPDSTIVGSSPEILVRSEGGQVTVRPIAGTIRRGRNAAEDLRLEKRLRADPKERAEHVMLVDLGRNDIGRVCKKGSVNVRDLMSIERYSHVMHLVSNVTGSLRKDRDVYDVLEAAFPAGTVTGAPKIRAMEIIDELETIGRGPYAGAIGYISFSGNLDMCITIRTILAKDGMAYVQAGAGIVADSNPTKEYRETMAKAAGMVQAVTTAELL